METKPPNLAFLEASLIAANIAYTVDCEPIMTDKNYDELKSLYLAQHEVLYGEPPKRPVSLMGIKTSGDAIVIRHPFPMLSLTNVFSAEELLDKLRSCKTPYPLFVEFKLDGSSLELIYNKQGELTHALKRGDGEEGEAVTHLVDGIVSIPKQVVIPEGMEGSLVVRGEVVITDDDFKKIQRDREQRGEKLFSNSRNAAAGGLNLKSVGEVKERALTFFAYSFRSTDDKNHGFGNYTKLTDLKAFFSNQFKTVPTIANIENDQTLISLLSKDRTHFTPKLPIDGLVFKADAVKAIGLGNSGEGPRYAFAYKFPEELVTTHYRGLRYQVGRTGQVTPVLEVEPVVVSGAEVTNVTIHNFTKLKEFAPKEGARCVIKRAGEVIPHLVSTSTQGEEFTPITRCPCCDSELTTIGELTYCTNDYRCVGRLQAYFSFLVSRKVFNVRDIGTKTIEELIERNYIRMPGDLWRVTKEQWYSLDKTEHKKVSKILTSLGVAAIQPAWRVIYASGIREVGESTAKILERACEGEPKRLAEFSIEELMQLRDVGEETAKAVYAFFHSDDSIWLNDLLEVIKVVYTKPKDGFLNGKSVVVTGGFPIPRDAIKEKIESLGGKLVSSVSAKTDYALVGENAGAKRAKAESLNIPLLDLNSLGL